MLHSDVLKRDLDVLFGEMHFASEGAVWLPLARVARSALFQHLVDLLKSETLGLGNKEESEEDYLFISDLSHVALRIRKNSQEIQQSEPHRKKTLDPRRAESSRSATRYGVMIPMIQFQNQLLAVERPTPRDRMVRGKISPMTIQAQGPQVVAKTEIFKQMNAIIARVAFGLAGWSAVFLPAVAPIAPTMNCIMTVPAAPKTSRGRLPIFSTIMNEAGVDSTLTRVVTSEMRKGLEIEPSCWKKTGPK